MPSDGDSFLPRIQSVFYAVFDLRQGPKIVYQVPEGLIAVLYSGGNASSTSLSSSSSPAHGTPSGEAEIEASGRTSRGSSSSIRSPVERRRPNSRNLESPVKRSSSNRTLFNFDDISSYVIPRSALCGRLVICSTRKHRIIGFPVELRGDYERNYFRYNLCFVFERSADLSCYEPIVRKVSRVLTACEEESNFLSSPKTSPTLHAILEQLYEDLNSYSETSIPIDEFNSIELKIFPFYPNPTPVKDWMVPLALINLSQRIEPNWDITMVKVCKFIDGVNHVSRIAHLADCDPELTRQAISHLLYYQVIMMIDIFQYSNMYTLRKGIQWLADEPHVREECASYVTKSGKAAADWPKLLHLYSRLRPGRTVFEWMERYGVHDLSVDVRRFTSFGVIKGFLRRVHRWPILLPEDPNAANSGDDSTSTTRTRVQSFPKPTPHGTTTPPIRGRAPETAAFTGSVSPVSPEVTPGSPITRRDHDLTATALPRFPVRRSSAAERILEKLQLQPNGGTIATLRISSRKTSSDSRRNSLTTANFPLKPNRDDGGVGPWPRSANHDLRRNSTNTFLNLATSGGGENTLPPSPQLPHIRPRFSRSPSTPHINAPQMQTSNSQGSATTNKSPFPPFPSELLPLLDGEHHTDELATRFQVGWPLLEQWLIEIGGGKGEGDFGRVLIIYR